MAQMYRFTDANGEVRLMAEIDPAPSSQPVTARAFYGGNNVSIPNTGAATSLTWNTLAAGTELLDRTDPALPTIVTAGVYALTINTHPQSDMTDGKAFEFGLDMGSSVSLRQTVAAQDAFDFALYGLIAVTYYLAAADPLSVTVQQADAGAINFRLDSAYLQRLS